MSTSDLYRIYRTKSSHLVEYRNGHGTAPVIWDHLSVRFLGMERHTWFLDPAKAQPLWDLARDPTVPRPYRLVHAFCCDWAICPPEHTLELADACDEVFRGTSNPTQVNHWAAIAKDLRQHKAKARQVGIGLTCTSVSDIWSGWAGDPKPFDIFDYVDTPTEGKSGG